LWDVANEAVAFGEFTEGGEKINNNKVEKIRINHKAKKITVNKK